MTIDCRSVSASLARDCERLFRELVPDCEVSRNELRGHGPDGAVWSIVTRGAKLGVWANWSDSERQRGDCLELVHWCLFPHERGRGESYAWALEFLGIDRTPGESAEARAGRHAARRQATKDELERRRVAEAAERERQRHKARGVYLAETASLTDSPEIADYYRTRGIPFDELPWPPRVLRFGRKWYSRERPSVPAIVAAIIDPITHRHVASHCTYVEFRDGHWRNIEGRPRRLTFGAKSGGIIPLMRGASGKRVPPAGDTLLIGEGIENSLAAALCCPGASNLPDNPRVWAGVDIGNFASIELPPEIHSVILVHDQDNERFGELRERLARKWMEEDRSVQNLRPPRGFKDFNDYVAELGKRQEMATCH